MFNTPIRSIGITALLIIGTATSSCNENRNENVQEEGVEERLEEGSDLTSDTTGTDHRH